ncbi:hypothetical protein Asi02nite_69440 [Asanoa siamensis]|uniref:GGDEF domain-containing protein n=1 Tax=Asanoa siamensis TaxID=926357 RepID=A0ABQ4D1L5_9ACTN|nr:hypothetical protein Asi02nite_69440 [Asanoa siamensis]
MVDHIARVQRAIANGEPLQEIFDTVTEAARDLLDTELASLHLAQVGLLRFVAESMSPADVTRGFHPPHLNRGIGYAAYRLGRLVRTDDYPSESYAMPRLAQIGARSAMSAPVRNAGEIVGSLAVISFVPGHRFSSAQEQMLLMFADQVSVALTDTKVREAAEQALTDPVTGLPSRLVLLDQLEKALARNEEFDVLFVDLDGFKAVNDTKGHAAGDLVLREIADRLGQCVRSTDSVVRFGGDEFAVLIRDVSLEALYRIGRTMLEMIRRPCVVHGEEIKVGASIGAAGRDPAARDAEGLLRRADTAMYRAKRGGGNQMVIFTRGMRIDV